MPVFIPKQKYCLALITEVHLGINRGSISRAMAAQADKYKLLLNTELKRTHLYSPVYNTGHSAERLSKECKSQRRKEL